MILLDTSVLSRAFRRSRPGPSETRARAVVENLMTADAAVALPGVVLQEVLSGIRSRQQFTELEQLLVASFTVLVATSADHIAAAKLRNLCLANGLNVSGTDCLIAALAIAGHHRLLAHDDDFAAIARHSALKLITLAEL